MPLKSIGNPKRRIARRKVALACDSCREKKIRCDGNKPVCGPCERRLHRIGQCVYNVETARSASRDEYFHTLHQRIRELEETCSRAGVSHRTSFNPQLEPPGISSRREKASEKKVDSPSSANPSSPDKVEQNLLHPCFETGEAPSPNPPVICSKSDKTYDDSIVGGSIKSKDSPLFEDDEGRITGMGHIAAPAGRPGRQSTQFQFYGSSSTASLMRFACQSIPSEPTVDLRSEPEQIRLHDIPTDYGFDDFSLPSRNFADHLLNCFFDKVYVLYPFFHRPAFEAAYQNLWRAQDEPHISLTDSDIGLGSNKDSGPRSIVFHSALNTIFALGCQYADIPVGEVEHVAHSFFLRSKRFIGLDFLDVNTLGVVQVLLITAIFLQSSPYPSRCWHSVGVACRVALGLGLQDSDILSTLTPLESDIRRRTWHGCVMMDITLSMTYGRPSMTTHLAPLPPPSPSDISGRAKSDKPSIMAFYTEAIKLYNILDRILSDVYKAWCGLSRQDQSRLPVKNLGGLDTVLEIGNQLVHFESELPFFLKWGQIQSLANVDTDLSSTLAQQRNVLNARYIHLHLLLYRPIFTQLYSERVRQQKMVDRPELSGNSKFSPIAVQSDIYSSMASKCETACLMAAIDLTHLIHDTYQTNAADAWWYNGFYISTAAVVLLMSFSAPPMLDQSIVERARESWRQAMTVLGNMATFRHSAGNTLQFLQDAYRQAVPNDLNMPGVENDASKLPREIDQSNDSFDHSHQDLVQASFFNWEEFSANVEPDLDDLAFLTRLDFRQG